MEDSLDEVIRTCAQQLFDLTDDPDNVRYPYTWSRVLVKGAL